jgi:RNA polymerase sigma factor (sigma-70 family)
MTVTSRARSAKVPADGRPRGPPLPAATNSWPDRSLWIVRHTMASAAASPAFSLAYQRFVPPIRAKCQRLLGRTGEAEEVVQETFLRLWQADIPLPPETEPRALMAWLYRTCTHLAIDHLRSQRRRPRAADAALDTLPCSIALDAWLNTKQILEALAARVPADELQAAVLCRVDGLSHAEAAEVQGTSERTLRRLLAAFDQRAAKLRKESSS